jgi:hypothetical protein
MRTCKTLLLQNKSKMFPIDLIFASLLTQYVVHNKNVFGISGKINNLVDGERQETKVKNALRAAQ